MANYYTKKRKISLFITALLVSISSVCVAQCGYINTFPYVESFNASPLPSCWTATNNGGSYINWATTNSDGYNGVSGPVAGNSFLFLDVYDAESGYNPYTVTTGGIALGSRAKQLSYYYFLGDAGYQGANGDPAPLIVQISTDGGNTWNVLYTHDYTNSTFAGSSSTTGWTLNAIDLTPYINDTVMIQFVGNSNWGYPTCDIGIDEFEIQNAPTCFPPTALNVPVIGGTNATFSWTPPVNGAPYGYLWEIRTSGGGGSGSAGLVVSDSTHHTTDSTNALAPLTTYNLYVSSECDTTLGNSTWAGPFSFTTTTLPCAGRPTAGTAVSSSIGVCTATLSLTGTTTGYTGITYQWQQRFPSGSGSFTNIVSATGDTSVASLPGLVTDFRCVVRCGNSSLSDTSSVITVTASPGTAGGFSPIAVTGFNQDVIANGTNNHSANPPSLTTTTTVDASNGYDFYDASYSFDGTTYPSTSLPVNGQVVSNSITGLLYQLKSATDTNVLQLRGGGAPGTTLSGTLTLVMPQSGTEVYLLGVSGNGSSTMDAVVNFTDGSSQTFTGLSVNDWFNGTPYSQGGFGRVNSTGFDGGAPGGNNPRMYDISLALDPSNYSKLVKSIDVTNTTPGADDGDYILNIFAATMAVSNPSTFCGGLATSVSLFNAAPGGVTYQWGYSTTSGGPYVPVTTGSGANTTTYTSTATGSLYYAVQGTCTSSGLIAISNEVNININPAVTVGVTPTSVNYCAGGAGVTLSAISADPGLVYSWSPAGGLNSTRDSTVIATPSATTVYNVTAYNSGGCSNIASVTVTYILAPVVSQISASPSSLCTGDSSYINVVASTPAPAYCIPSISDAYSHYLGSFNLTDTTGATTYVTTTNNYSPGTFNNYVDHGTNNTNGPLVAGSTYDFNGTYGSIYEGAAIWIDFNQDGVFQNNELLYAAYGGNASGGAPFSGSFSIPLTALNGTTKMRVRDMWGSDTIPDNNGLYSCGPGNTDGFNTYGETDDYTITITGGVTSASLSYSWSPAGTLTNTSISNPVAIPTNGISTYTVTISNGICSVVDSVSDTTGVALAIAPTASTGASAPYCSGSTTFQLSANRTGGGAPFVYSWRSVPAGFASAASTVSVTPDTTTKYYLTVRDTCGSTVSDSLTVTVIQTPVVAVTPITSTYCTGGTADMLIATGATTYSWNPSSSLNTSSGDTVYASPTSTTSYSVTGYSQGCSATAYVSVNVTSAPVISMISAPPANPSICANHQSQLDVVASSTRTYCVPSISNTFLHYLAGFNLTDTTGVTEVSTTNNFSPGTANNYVDHGTSNTSNTLTAGNTYDFSGTYGGAYEGLAIWIDFNQNGVFENSELLYAAYGGYSSGGGAFSGSFVIPVSALSGTTKMRVRDGWGSDTIADNTGLYSCTAGNSDGFNTYGETDDYTITISGGVTPTYLSYTWSPSGTLNNPHIANPVATPTTTTGYTVLVTDSATGCSVSATDTVTVLPAIPLADSVSGPTATVCAGVSSVLNVRAIGGCAPYRYAWSPAGAGANNNANDTVSPIITTTYRVTVTDSAGSHVTATYTVNVVNPIVVSTSPANVCGTSGTATLIAIPSNGASISWSNSISGGTIVATGDTFRPIITSTTTYYAFATSTLPVCASVSRTPVVASINANPTLTLNGSLVNTCRGTAAPLAITSIIPAHSSYVWSPRTGLYTTGINPIAYAGGNAANLNGLPNASTRYTVVLFDSITGCSASASDSVNIYQLPNIHFLSPDTSICPGSVISERVIFAGTGPWTFSHTTDEANSPISVTTSANPYNFSDTPTVSGPIAIISLSDAHCAANRSGLDTIVVTVDSIRASFTLSATSVPLGDSIIFTNTSLGAVSYRWAFGDGGTASTQDPVHTYSAQGDYTVTLSVTNSLGCASVVSEKDTVTKALGIADVTSAGYIFNIFSYQNKVMVDFSQFKTVDATIQIYNLLGQELSHDTYHSADTYVKALDLDAAYVIVRVQMSDGQVAVKKVFIHQ